MTTNVVYILVTDEIIPMRKAVLIVCARTNYQWTEPRASGRCDDSVGVFLETTFDKCPVQSLDTG